MHASREANVIQRGLPKRNGWVSRPFKDQFECDTLPDWPSDALFCLLLVVEATAEELSAIKGKTTAAKAAAKSKASATPRAKSEPKAKASKTGGEGPAAVEPAEDEPTGSAKSTPVKSPPKKKERRPPATPAAAANANRRLNFKTPDPDASKQIDALKEVGAYFLFFVICNTFVSAAAGQ